MTEAGIPPLPRPESSHQMGFINVAERTINAKLVYYGVGVGGKTTSLQQVHSILCPRNEVQLVSINTEQDSTLLFDFLPMNLGTVGGFKIRVHTLLKVPYLLVVGDREVEKGQVALRARNGDDLGTMTIDEFSRLLAENVEKKGRT